VSATLLVLFAATACPAATPVAGPPGLAAVARLPATSAMRLNGEGKQLYRQERWQDAREKYRAALSADPDLLGAALNVACSYSRQGRYVEAAEEASALIRRAFVPWSREVAEAADLGILQSHPAYARVEAARKEAAGAWGERLASAVFLLARTKPPINLTGEGVLVLGLNQEVFGWVPETGRFFQVTAEDGRVLAFARSADGRRLTYLLGGKLVRGAGQVGVLRGLSLRVLDLPTMTLAAPEALPGDLRSVELGFAAHPHVRVTDASGETSDFSLTAEGLERGPSRTRRLAGTVLLTADGVVPGSQRIRRPGCVFSLSPRREGGTWRLQVARRGRKPFLLDTRYGAALAGMPFPTAPLASVGTQRNP
jgi:hypothetical protein